MNSRADAGGQSWPKEICMGARHRQGGISDTKKRRFPKGKAAFCYDRDM
jgi:hypothetical protein